jgi:5,10-methylene-tetrahydrofolate dehydrogenase/methenyl tetrahydrofolate cyclohydrolase
MSTTTIDGKEVAQKIREGLATEIAELKALVAELVNKK